MYSLFNTPINSPLIIILTIIFGITASIIVFDKRLLQAKKAGTLPPDEPSLPKWVAGVYWIYLIVLWAIVLLNWKFGLIVYISKFILSVLPVLEVIGNVIMSPFKQKVN